MLNKMSPWSLFLLGMVLSVTLFAGLSPTEIVRRGDKVMRGETTQVLMRMEIERPDYNRSLQLRSWTSTSKKTLVEILEPMKEEGVCSLRVNDQMWNFLPKTDRIVRVPTSMMLQSWMGSDFTNDDLMKLSSIAEDYEHKILKKERVSGHETTLIECKPKPNAPVVWGKILYWARASDNLPVKEEYYDERGELVRTLDLERFEKMDDRIIPTRLTIRKAENPKQLTRITYEKILFDRVVEDSLFDSEKLRTNSQRGKKISELWSTDSISNQQLN